MTYPIFLRRLSRGAIVAAVVAGLCPATAVGAAPVRDLCVGPAPGCFTEVQGALDASHDGDLIRILPGRFSGGIQIRSSVTLVGAGAGRTVLAGGGPVVTVGANGAATEPTVVLRGLRVTGGVVASSEGLGHLAFGGGIWIPPSAGSGPGAALTVLDSAVDHNVAKPTSTVRGGPACPTGPYPFALAAGAGIESSGRLTLVRTVVRDNAAGGPLASDADGAGILAEQGDVTLDHSWVTDNHASTSAPNGRFAEGGGVLVRPFFAPSGSAASLTIRDSVIARNTVVMASSLPSFAGDDLIAMDANAGGVQVGDGVPTTVANTLISENAAVADDPRGEPVAIDGGMLVGDSLLTMTSSIVAGNRTRTTQLTSADVGPGGSALELDGPGTIDHSTISGNTSVSVSAGGLAATNSGLAVLNFNEDPGLVTVEDSSIEGNVGVAISRSGSATVQGGGVFNNSLLSLRHVRVVGNVGRVEGPAGAGEGGGIWNGVDLSGPPVELTLIDTLVLGNTLTGSAGVALAGGGLFTNTPVGLHHSPIVGNRPDQCRGCDTQMATTTRATETAAAGPTQRRAGRHLRGR